MNSDGKSVKWIFVVALVWLASGNVLGFYNPNYGRWTTRDPIEEKDSPNLYEFVNNNPIWYIDPLGLKRWIMFYYSRPDQGEFNARASFQCNTGRFCLERWAC